jgi:hypothetical protein
MVFPKLDLCDNAGLLEIFLSYLASKTKDKADTWVVLKLLALWQSSADLLDWFQKLIDLSDKADLLGRFLRFPLTSDDKPDLQGRFLIIDMYTNLTSWGGS